MGLAELAEELQGPYTGFNDYEYPKVSVIIPVYNCSQSIPLTLERLLQQDYPDFEVVVVDAGSTDRTLETIGGFRSEKVRLFSVSAYRQYEMLNKGISQAGGEYLNFLFPGDFYTSRHALRSMMTLALANNRPEALFCGTLLRSGKREPRLLYRRLSMKILRLGRQPTSLQSFWIRSDVFKKIGKFDTRLKLRGGYDFLCRYCLYGKFKTVSAYRVYTDYDLRYITRALVWRHFVETWRTLFKYFGVLRAFFWLFIQKDTLRLFKLWFARVRTAFSGRRDSAM